jgi:uncharacterized membrane protein
MKKHFLTGLVILLPFVVSVLIFAWIIEFLTAPFMHVTESILFHLGWEGGPLLTVFLSRAMAIISLISITFLVGYFGSKLIIASFLHKIHSLFSRIPGLRTIYKFSKEIASKVFDAKAPTFDGSVLIPFPHAKAHALGLYTNKIPQAVKDVNDKLEITVFVPTAPHPISGFIVLCEKKDVQFLDLKTEEVFKFQISCGVLSDTKGKSCPK